MGVASNKATFLLATVCAFWIFSQSACDAQIEVDAYIPDFALGHGRYIAITNNNNNTVSIIDSVTRTVVASLNVAAGLLGIATSPNDKYIYVTSAQSILTGTPGNNMVYATSTATDTVVSSVDNANLPVGIAVTPNGQFVYAATQNGTGGSVTVINTNTNTLTDTIPIPIGPSDLLNTPRAVVVAPDGKYAYVSDNSSNLVSVINTAMNKVVLSIPVGPNPIGITITPNGQYVYVADNSDPNPRLGFVSVISTATNTVIATIPVGPSPVGIDVTPNGKYVYVVNSTLDYGEGTHMSPPATLSVISTATNRVVDTITVGGLPFALGEFVGPNIIVPQGGPLMIANDAALTPLGFRQYVDFNGGTLKMTGNLVTSRTISLLANGGTIDTGSFNATFSGDIINSGSLTKIGAGSVALSGINTYSGGTILDAGALVVAGSQALGLGDVVVNGGVLEADAQSINVKGNYVQNAVGRAWGL